VAIPTAAADRPISLAVVKVRRVAEASSTMVATRVGAAHRFTLPVAVKVKRVAEVHSFMAGKR
jgi:hypothetical protein